MVKAGDTIKYIRTVTSPPHQAGRIGDTKTVGKDISLFHARYLLKGATPYIEIVTPTVPERKPKAATPERTV